MSTALVKEMARQCASKAVCNGHNVMITIPAGPLSSEFRRSSMALLEAGAIIRPKNYMGAINSSDGALTVIISHDMVDVLINKHIGIAKEKTEERFGRYAKHLSRGLANSLPKGAVELASISIDNLNSVSSMTSKLTVTGKTGDRITIDYKMNRELLALMRRIIAPYNLKNAEVEVHFTADGEGPISLSLNGMALRPTRLDEIASITTVSSSSAKAPVVTLRKAAGFPSFR
jgi:hypothetical protein